MDSIYSDTAIPQARRGTLVGQVMGLLAFSLLFTAGGALLGRQLGPGAILISIAGSIGTLIALYFTKNKPGLNLGLFYAFSVFEGMALGLIIESYLARGLGTVVVNAAATTGGLVMLLGAYAWTTRRDLSGLSGYLLASLLAVIVASLVGFFLQAPLFHLILSAATALLFSGFVLYDIQRLRNAKGSQYDAVLLAVSIYLAKPPARQPPRFPGHDGPTGVESTPTAVPGQPNSLGGEGCHALGAMERSARRRRPLEARFGRPRPEASHA